MLKLHEQKFFRRGALDPDDVLRETYPLMAVPGSPRCGAHTLRWLDKHPGAPRTREAVTQLLIDAARPIVGLRVHLETPAQGHVSTYLPGSKGYPLHTDLCATYHRRLVVVTVLLEGPSLFEVEPHGMIEMEPGDAVAFSGWARHAVHPIQDRRRISLVAWLNSVEVPTPPEGWENRQGFPTP